MEEHYPIHMEEGVKGPAYIIVPISESPVDKAVFNACAKYLLGRKVASTEELERVYDFQMEKEPTILRALKKLGSGYWESSSELKRVEDRVYETLKRSKRKK